MFYNALVKFRDEQLENYQGQPLEYSASDYHHIARPGGRARRGRSQSGQGSSKRRAQHTPVTEFPRRMSSFKEPMSSGTMESFDPYRSPKHAVASEPQYAQITIHQPSTQGESSPVVKPPPSIAEVEEEQLEDADEPEGSSFTILQKRKHKPSSMMSFHSSRVPHSSSRVPGLTTHTASYRRNVSFRYVRNRSNGSATAKSKRRKTAAPTQQNEIKRSPSTCSLQIMADVADLPDMPSSPPLPAQPTVVRSHGPQVKSLRHVRKLRASDYTWREDTRKVSHELSQICEEAFNGSSVSTIRTASAGSGYETPATPVSMVTPENRPPSATKPVPKTPKDAPRSYSIKELTETRRRLAQQSQGRKDSTSAHITGVLNHFDRLIEEYEAVNATRREPEEVSFHDPFVSAPHGRSLPVISEELARPTGGGNIRPRRKLRTSAATSQGGDVKTTIRMVPHSSFRSMEEVKPLTIRKKKSDKPLSSDVHDFANSPPSAANRNFSTGLRQAPPAFGSGGLAPIEEVPLSPKRNNTRGEGKKWSWFKHRSQGSDTPPALPPKDYHPIFPSGGTAVHKPITLEPTPAPIESTQRVPTRKTSMDRFAGGLFKKLMPKKSTKNMQETFNGEYITTDIPTSQFNQRTEQETEKPATPPQEKRHSSIVSNGMPDTDSSFDADDHKNPFRHKRRSVANHNWFARVFQIKPASRVIALNCSKQKGRRELYKLLREWRDYGMEDVWLDKSNSVVHGRVSEANCEIFCSHFLIRNTNHMPVLRLREVEFTAEFYTVLEHGREGNLGVVRFKQERGAASSFNQVVEAVENTLKRRGMTVEDPVRAKKMTQVLDSIPNHKQAHDRTR